MSTLPETALLAIERAAVRGWPAFETASIDGWLVRASAGGSMRANTVAALDYTGGSLTDSIGRVVAFYRERGIVPRFTVSDASAPANLDAELENLGWRRSSEHVTMVKDVGTPLASASALTVVETDAPTKDWYSVYLLGLSDNRKAAAPRLVEGVPPPRVFFSCIREGHIIASGLSVIDGPLASVQCMATLPGARRTGAATAVLSAIEANAARRGAKLLYLQAESENAPAIGAYGRYGFTVAGRYHTRDLAPG